MNARMAGWLILVLILTLRPVRGSAETLPGGPAVPAALGQSNGPFPTHTNRHYVRGLAC